MSSDLDPSLNLDEGSDPAPGPDRAFVEVDEAGDGDVVGEAAVPDQPEGGVVGGLLSDGPTISPRERERSLMSAITSLDRWASERSWVGPDPYEGLNARRAGPLRRSPLGRRALIQLVKRSPLDLRRPLGIAPQANSMSLAHVLAAYARLAAGPSAGLPAVAARIEPLVERLASMRCPGYHQPSWGYHFDVQTRFFFYGAGTPNSIATAFAGHALLDADARGLGGGGPLELARGAGEFLLAEIPRTETPAGAFFGYLPGDRTPIHNANLLVCGLLARLGARLGDERMRAAAAGGVSYALAHQDEDGSWPYAETSSNRWVDGFHTGYVLDALRQCAVSLDDGAALDAWRRGLRFYAERLFLGDGTPKHYVEQTYPIDAQCAAQGIRTFAEAAADDPGWIEGAWSIYAYSQRRLRRRDGAYLFQRRRWWTNRVPHVRWVQAPTLDAFARLAAHRARGEHGGKAR